MTACGTATFVDPDCYLGAIPDARASLVLTGRGDFTARATWLKLGELHIFRGCEDLARIAYVSWLPARSFVSFPIGDGGALTWSGIDLRCGDVVLHSHGERSHQRTTGTVKWGFVSLPPERLAAYGKALTGTEIICPGVGRVQRPSPSAMALLLRLHAKACHLAETKPEIVSYKEAARALEQEIVHALVNCLAIDGGHQHVAPTRNHVDIMVSFEGVLSTLAARQTVAPELATAVGVSERTLRACCSEFLGTSPGRYIRLRRLNTVRAELLRADPATANVAEIARRHQFSELGRFAATYRAAFGEMPSDTLRRPAITGSRVRAP